MRIRNAVSSRRSDPNTGSASSTNSSSLARTLFSAEMQQQDKTIDGYDREIGELRKEIESAGDKLDKEPTITNFKQFRDILSKLAKRINAEAYRLEKCGGTPQNPRYY